MLTCKQLADVATSDIGGWCSAPEGSLRVVTTNHPSIFQPMAVYLPSRLEQVLQRTPVLHIRSLTLAMHVHPLHDHNLAYDFRRICIFKKNLLKRLRGLEHLDLTVPGIWIVDHTLTCLQQLTSLTLTTERAYLTR